MNDLKTQAQELLEFFQTANTEHIDNIRRDNHDTWGRVLGKCVNEHCQTIRLENYSCGGDYETYSIVDTNSNEIIGNFYAISLHFRDTFYGPRCTVWISDREDFQLQPVICI